MISVEGLKVEFGVKPLFVDASFVINDRDRIALVGKNGAGKSTMLKILCGQQKPTAGTVSVPNDCGSPESLCRHHEDEGTARQDESGTG